MIEAIGAIAIILMGISAVLSLVIINLIANQDTKNRTIALALAQEAIEVVRNKRDSNWLAIQANVSGVSWNSGLSNGTDYSAAVVWDPTSNGWSFNWTPANIASCAENTCLVYKYNDLYLQSVIGSPTIFSRIVHIDPICLLADGVTEKVISDGTDCSSAYPGSTEIGVQVKAIVVWKQNSQHQVSLTDNLYNWK